MDLGGGLDNLSQQGRFRGRGFEHPATAPRLCVADMGEGTRWQGVLDRVLTRARFLDFSFSVAGIRRPVAAPYRWVLRRLGRWQRLEVGAYLGAKAGSS